MKFLFIIDDWRDLELAGDTSYALMLESASQGIEVYTCKVGDLGIQGVDAVAWVQKTGVQESKSNIDAFDFDPATSMKLADFDAVWMRKDPPLDTQYLHATWILERARDKTLLINDPRGLRELNEHLSILSFEEFIPDTIVTRSEVTLRAFMKDMGGSVVIKPIDGYGGRGVFVVNEKDPNRGSLFESATSSGQDWTMAQRYVPEAKLGDKRIILCDGDVMGAVLRVPPKTEARGNLHVGGRAQKTTLTKREEQIVEKIRPLFKKWGILFAGIDVIGDYLTEINITSPTGIRQISELNDENTTKKVIDKMSSLIR